MPIGILLSYRTEFGRRAFASCECSSLLLHGLYTFRGLRFDQLPAQTISMSRIQVVIERQYCFVHEWDENFIFRLQNDIILLHHVVEVGKPAADVIHWG